MATRPPLLNIYCDESGHLERDLAQPMVLGAVTCPEDVKALMARELASIKDAHGLPSTFEIKWTKVSASKIDFYLDLVQWFFSRDVLTFRAVVIDKSKLQHEAFGQTHDEFYYKQWFLLLKRQIDNRYRYRIYLDIKDTRSEDRVQRLRNVLCNASRDTDGSVIERVQHVRSHEVALLQIADLLTGTVAYANTGLTSNAGKVALVDRVRALTGLGLVATTSIRVTKFNMLVWRSRGS